MSNREKEPEERNIVPQPHASCCTTGCDNWQKKPTAEHLRASSEGLPPVKSNSYIVWDGGNTISTQAFSHYLLYYLRCGENKQFISYYKVWSINTLWATLLLKNASKQCFLLPFICCGFFLTLSNTTSHSWERPINSSLS